MLQKLIRFLRDIARQEYESFVVYGDTTDINFSNMRITDSEINAGYFWDRRWFVDMDINNLSIGFPCLGIERDSRTLLDERTAKDHVWITLTSSDQADSDAQRHVKDPTKTWAFTELSSLMVTIMEADLVRHIPSGQTMILHKTQYTDNPDYEVVRYQILTQEESLELVWLNSQDRSITVGCKIQFDDCTSSKYLSLLEPLVTDLEPTPRCC